MTLYFNKNDWVMEINFLLPKNIGENNISLTKCFGDCLKNMIKNTRKYKMFQMHVSSHSHKNESNTYEIYAHMSVNIHAFETPNTSSNNPVLFSLGSGWQKHDLFTFWITAILNFHQTERMIHEISYTMPFTTDCNNELWRTMSIIHIIINK